MITTSTFKIELSKEDTIKLLQTAVAQVMKTQFNIDVDPENLVVRLNASMDYGQLDNGPGSPVCTGVTAEIRQPVVATNSGYMIPTLYD